MLRGKSARKPGWNPRPSKSARRDQVEHRGCGNVGAGKVTLRRPCRPGKGEPRATRVLHRVDLHAGRHFDLRAQSIREKVARPLLDALERAFGKDEIDGLAVPDDGNPQPILRFRYCAAHEQTAVQRTTTAKIPAEIRPVRDLLDDPASGFTARDEYLREAA